MQDDVFAGMDFGGGEMYGEGEGEGADMGGAGEFFLDDDGGDFQLGDEADLLASSVAANEGRKDKRGRENGSVVARQEIDLLAMEAGRTISKGPLAVFDDPRSLSGATQQTQTQTQTIAQSMGEEEEDGVLANGTNAADKSWKGGKWSKNTVKAAVVLRNELIGEEVGEEVEAEGEKKEVVFQTISKEVRSSSRNLSA